MKIKSDVKEGNETVWENFSVLYSILSFEYYCCFWLYTFDANHSLEHNFIQPQTETDSLKELPYDFWKMNSSSYSFLAKTHNLVWQNSTFFFKSNRFGLKLKNLKI